MSKKTRKKSSKHALQKGGEDIGQKIRHRSRPHGREDASQKNGQETGASIAQGPVEKVKSERSAKIPFGCGHGIEDRRQAGARKSSRQESARRQARHGTRQSRLVERGRQSARLPTAARRRKQCFAGRLSGKKLVIFFYPRADTPGCTKEAIDFTRLSGAFAGSQTAVLGVSADPLKAQEAFRDKHQLSIPLVSDETHEMLQAYGVWGEKSMYGKTFLGILRTTVLIDGRGQDREDLAQCEGRWPRRRGAGRCPSAIIARFRSRKINHERVKSPPQIEPNGRHFRPARECRCRIVRVNIPMFRNTMRMITEGRIPVAR